MFRMEGLYAIDLYHRGEDCELYRCDVENSGVGAVFASRGATPRDWMLCSEGKSSQRQSIP